MMMMSELQHASYVELSDLLRLAAPAIVQTDDVPAVDGLAAVSRRPGGGRRAHRRTGSTAADPPSGSGARRNERERNRVRHVNAGFDRLRDHVPQGRRNRKLSKVDTLRAAVEYIDHLQSILRHADGDDAHQTVDATDENYVSGSTAEGWYLDARFCGDLERVSAEPSLTQLLVDPEHIARALASGSLSTSCSAVDHRLTVDVGVMSSPTADGLSFAGSVGCGGCATPESIDQEVTSSSVDDPLDEDAEQLLNFGSWLS